MTSRMVLSLLATVGLAYLVGAVPFGLILGRALRGVDLREHGSGNLGATNALRVLGVPLGLTVLALDFAKGCLPTLAAEFHPATANGPGWSALAAGLAAVLGHVFPIYLGFRGGKGVATGAGVLAALAPLATAIAAVVFALTVAATRYVSLGSILAALALPITLAVTSGPAALDERLPALLAASSIAVLVLARHRENVTRLLRGTENKLGRSRSGPKITIGP